MSAPANLTRVFAVIEALSGNSRHGLRLAQIAEAVRQSAPTTLRDLQSLEAIGYAGRIPGKDERWHLKPRLVQIAIAHHAEVGREESQLDDFKNRYSRSPN